MCKGGHVAAPGCEWDTRGGFTKSGPGDSQMRVPRSFFLSVSYVPRTPGRRGRSGRSEVDGSDPPFLVPESGTAGLRKSHLRNTPWEGRSRLNHPCGKARTMGMAHKCHADAPERGPMTWRYRFWFWAAWRP